MSNKNLGGRPPKYKDPEELKKKVDAYFEDCKGEVLRNGDGDPVLNKFGEPVYVGGHPLTVTGLALALGFTTRHSLLAYQGKAAFRDIITEAKTKVEAYAEERLFDKDGCNGAKFSLQNNFREWDDTRNVEMTGGPVVNIINDIPKEAPTKPDPQMQEGNDAADSGG